MTKLQSRSLALTLFATLTLVVCVTLLGASGKAFAQSGDCIVDRYNNTVCPPAKSVCIKESTNSTIKCSPPDGGIALSRYGVAQCGVGRCVSDIRGDLLCSKESGGSAAQDLYGNVVCTGGCAPAQASACSTPTR